ncbi:MAG: DUF6265 family protein [Planctomycetota bacterium]|nr:DUF6265 family protein [Planctomycetota bacterium]
MNSLNHLLSTFTCTRLRVCALALPLLFVLGTGNLPQVESDGEAVTANPKIEDFAWLAGEWRGEGFGGTCEEIWSHPLAGTMVGTFRLVKDDQVVFYEIMVIGPDDDGFALKVKHFSREFVAWEDKEGAVRFPYESVKKGDARFSGLTFARDQDKLEIKVRMRESDGSIRWEPIQMKRHQPSKPNN